MVTSSGLVSTEGCFQFNGPSGELEFLIGDDCVERVVPECGGDSKACRGKQSFRMRKKNQRFVFYRPAPVKEDSPDL